MKREMIKNEPVDVLAVCRDDEEGQMAPIVPVHISEWSYFSFLMCAVAMAFKAKSAKPGFKVPSLMGLAGASVQNHCE